MAFDLENPFATLLIHCSDKMLQGFVQVMEYLESHGI